MNLGKFLQPKLLRYGLPVAAIITTAIGFSQYTEKINSTTVALSFLLIILCFATFFGRNPALLASFVGMLCFNYFFLHPVGTWFIADPQSLIAWTAFTITAIIAGEMSAYARRRAREAERLYGDLQAAFENAAHAEALRQSEKLKSALLDAVTHDLRTPLTSIKAAVTTLLDSEGGHRTIELDISGRAEFLEIIDEETDRLNRFIEGMVELARAEAGSDHSKESRAIVEGSLRNAVERAENLIRGHDLRLNVAKELPMIPADARAVAEVIYNIVENAAKYSAPGSKITISAEAVGNTVVITIADEGPGIPAEMRELVFEKFVRLDNAPADGLGLGLAISRSIIEAQGGTITIGPPSNGSGTTVTLKFPAAA